jgi:hypothetical protein
MPKLRAFIDAARDVHEIGSKRRRFGWLALTEQRARSVSVPDKPSPEKLWLVSLKCAKPMADAAAI